MNHRRSILATTTNSEGLSGMAASDQSFLKGQVKDVVDENDIDGKDDIDNPICDAQNENIAMHLDNMEVNPNASNSQLDPNTGKSCTVDITDTAQVFMFRRNSLVSSAASIPMNKPILDRVDTGLALWDASSNASAAHKYNYQMDDNQLEDLSVSSHHNIYDEKEDKESDELNSEYFYDDDDDGQDDIITPVPTMNMNTIKKIKPTNANQKHKQIYEDDHYPIKTRTSLTHDHESVSSEASDQNTVVIRGKSIDAKHDRIEQKDMELISNKPELLVTEQSLMLQVIGTGTVDLLRDNSIKHNKETTEQELDEIFYIENTLMEKRKSQLNNHKNNNREQRSSGSSGKSTETYPIHKPSKSNNDNGDDDDDDPANVAMLTSDNLMEHDFHLSENEFDCKEQQAYADNVNRSIISGMEDLAHIRRGNGGLKNRNKKKRSVTAKTLNYISAVGAVCAVALLVGYFVLGNRNNRHQTTRRVGNTVHVLPRRGKAPRI